MSLQYYSSEALSVLLQYPTSDSEHPSHAVGQLPTEAVASLPMRATVSHDISGSLSRSVQNVIIPVQLGENVQGGRK